MELYQHQQDLIKKSPKYMGLWWETGTGKSLALIELIKKNKVATLLVCPKSIKERWKRDTVGLSVVVATKEEFRRGHGRLSSFNALVIDECHAFANPRSQMHKACISWLKKNSPDYVWLASATPYRSSPWNAYALANILGHRLNWRFFRDKYFAERYLGHRIIYVPKETEESKKELSQFLGSIGNTVRLDDCVDMPEAVFEYEIVPLTAKEKNQIEELDEVNPAVRYSKIHQIENGTLKGNEFLRDLILPDNKKIQRIRELAEEAPKLAVFAKYRLQVESIADDLKTAGFRVFCLTGDTKDSDQVIREAEEAEEAVIIISCDKAEGYELPSFKTVVYASLPWSMPNYLQSLGRFRRINVISRVCYTILISDGEVDKAVKKSLDKKLDFNIKLYAENKK